MYNRVFRPATLDALARLSKQKVGYGAARTKLRRFMVRHYLTTGEFAPIICMGPLLLKNLLCNNHARIPTLTQALAIEWATKGEVPTHLWLEDVHAYEMRRKRRLFAARFKQRRMEILAVHYAKAKKPEAYVLKRARDLARLFNVQWGESKKRAFRFAVEMADQARANVDWLYAPPPIDEDQEVEDPTQDEGPGPGDFEAPWTKAGKTTP